MVVGYGLKVHNESRSYGNNNCKQCFAVTNVIVILVDSQRPSVLVTGVSTHVDNDSVTEVMVVGYGLKVHNESRSYGNNNCKQCFAVTNVIVILVDSQRPSLLVTGVSTHVDNDSLTEVMVVGYGFEVHNESRSYGNNNCKQCFAVTNVIVILVDSQRPSLLVTGVSTHVDNDSLTEVMVVGYGLEVHNAGVLLSVRSRPILVLAAQLRQRPAKQQERGINYSFHQSSLSVNTLVRIIRKHQTATITAWKSHDESLLTLASPNRLDAKRGRRGRAAPGVTFFRVTPTRSLNFKNNVQTNQK
ncbi:hypothetical protein J6590_019019 [Homalodisca vitripennis]|nr:hypothetical protein J6590_019019 [Homalodisca vitripennis]